MVGTTNFYRNLSESRAKKLRKELAGNAKVLGERLWNVATQRLSPDYDLAEKLLCFAASDNVDYAADLFSAATRVNYTQSRTEIHRAISTLPYLGRPYDRFFHDRKYIAANGKYYQDKPNLIEKAWFQAANQTIGDDRWPIYQEALGDCMKRALSMRGTSRRLDISLQTMECVAILLMREEGFKYKIKSKSKEWDLAAEIIQNIKQFLIDPANSQDLTPPEDEGFGVDDLIGDVTPEPEIPIPPKPPLSPPPSAPVEKPPSRLDARYSSAASFSKSKSAKGAHPLTIERQNKINALNATVEPLRQEGLVTEWEARAWVRKSSTPDHPLDLTQRRGIAKVDRLLAERAAASKSEPKSP